MDLLSFEKTARSLGFEKAQSVQSHRRTAMIASENVA